MEDKEKCAGNLCTTRRDFLLSGGTVLAGVFLAPAFQGRAEAVARAYPRKRIAKLSDLKVDSPKGFRYPYDDPHSGSFIIKLGAPAFGGVGPDRDIVAFNLLCTHMGGPLGGSYNAQYKSLGPCPFHLSTFDLTRHGMVVAGHASQALPQVLLEVSGSEIFAVGVMGLIYGYHSNLKA
jgi:arsenite oxidase small subunit